MGKKVDLLQHLLALLAERDLRYQQRFEAQSAAIGAAFAAAKEAVIKAETATEKRFEGVNEFRKTLSDQAAMFTTRVELEAWRAEIESWRAQSVADRRDLALRVQRIEGKSIGLNAGWGYIVAAVAIIVGIAGVLIALFKSTGATP